MSSELVIEGRILQIYPVVSGEGRNGKWERQAFVIETQSRYPAKVYIEVWGERRSMLSAYEPGNLVSVWIELSSREFNEKWYTSVRAWKMQLVGEGEHEVGALGSSAKTGVPANAPTVAPFDYKEDALEDDIPF